SATGGGTTTPPSGGSSGGGTTTPPAGGSSGGTTSGGTCAAAWSASQVYNGGNQASENGTNYTANWWTQGNDPVSNSGPAGSGQPWTNNGSCSGGSTGGTGG